MLHYCSNVSYAVIIVNSVITHVIPKLYMKNLAHCLLYKQSKSITPLHSLSSLFISPLLSSSPPPLFSSYLPSFFFPFVSLSNTHTHAQTPVATCMLINNHSSVVGFAHSLVDQVAAILVEVVILVLYHQQNYPTSLHRRRNYILNWPNIAMEKKNFYSCSMKTL